MAATVQINETNGAGATVTSGIANSNMGSIDAANLDPVAYPLLPSTRSYAKYQRLNVTAMGGASKIDNLKVWRTGALGTGAPTHVTNARISSYGGAMAYATPVNTAIVGVDQTMPTSEPASANLGIAGSLTGSLTGTGSSDYLVHQLIMDATVTEGVTATLNYQYDETT